MTALINTDKPKKRVVLISEISTTPPDEGLKAIVSGLMGQLNHERLFSIMEPPPQSRHGVVIGKIKFLILLINIKKKLSKQKIFPDFILYIPAAGRSFNSFVRAKILKMAVRRSKVAVLSAQHRKMTLVMRMFLLFFRPDLLFILSSSEKNIFEELKIKVKVLPPVVDKRRFCPVTAEEKARLRVKYNLPLDKTIVTHIGHIKKSRGLQCFLDIQKLKDIQTVIVGSTYTEVDVKLREQLQSSGVVVINEYMTNVEEIYQLSDIYIFPVISKYDAIEMPCSVIEALACDLRVITTQFGGLEEYFTQDGSFRYFDAYEELPALIAGMGKGGAGNHEKVEKFSWENFSEAIFAGYEELHDGHEEKH